VGDRYESTAFKATKGSASLKTTIPQVVAAVLGLDEGAKIAWELDPTTRSARVARGANAATEVTPAPVSPQAKPSKRV
jgi:hypothetical protein